MKDFVEPKINGIKQRYPVLAGIETEFELDDGTLLQPRIYLIDRSIDRSDPRPTIYFCYRRGQRGQRMGGYGMFFTDEMIEHLHAENRPDRIEHLRAENRPDRVRNRQMLKEALEGFVNRLFP